MEKQLLEGEMMEQEIRIKYPIAQPTLTELERRNLMEAFDSGWISSKGQYISKFEEEFSAYIGAEYGISCTNGTAALHLALLALGIGKGDEVIIPNITFVSPANAVLYTGAKPTLVDVDEQYWGLDPNRIEEKITSHTKAIIVVHLYGHPCDMDPIRKVAENNGLFIIEDCAEAHGAEYKGKKVGTFGDVSIFSFYANKIITTGEGGMLITNEEHIDSISRVLRDHGMSPNKKYWHDIIGYNYRMTNLQAAIGLAQLRNINSYIKAKRRIAKYYSRNLTKAFSIQPEMQWAKNIYWLTTILNFKLSNYSSRDNFINELLKNGVEARPVFYPLNQMPPYRNSGKFPNSVRISQIGLNLPSSPSLTERDLEAICYTLVEITE